MTSSVWSGNKKIWIVLSWGNEVLNLNADGLGNWHQSVLFTFSFMDMKSVGGKVEVCKLDSNSFGYPKTARIDYLEEELVFWVGCGRKEVNYLFFVEDDRQFAFLFWIVDIEDSAPVKDYIEEEV